MRKKRHFVGWRHTEGSPSRRVHECDTLADAIRNAGVLEEWRPIPGYPSYLASSYGRIMRIGPNGGSRVGSILSGVLNKDRGYVYVTLAENGNNSSRSVHRVIALAFFGPCPDGLQVNHKNGNKTDNRPDNLEYVTASENQQHAWDSGLRGPSPFSVLSPEDIPVVLDAYENQGRSAVDISGDYGVHEETIRRIIRGETWQREVAIWRSKQ